MNLNKTKAKAKAKTKPTLQDLIAPRVLAAGKTITFGGKYGVEKAELLFHWLVHMAAGKPFLGMTPPRPLRVFYLPEYDDSDFKKFMKSTKLDPELIKLSKPNLSISASIDSIYQLREAIPCAFGGEKVDIIVLDAENKIFADTLISLIDINGFARDKLEALRKAVNPDCGIMLIQHMKEKKEVSDLLYTIVEALYTSACDVCMDRNGEHPTRRVLNFKLNGKTCKSQVIDKVNGNWVDVSSVGLR